MPRRFFRRFALKRETYKGQWFLAPFSHLLHDSRLVSGKMEFGSIDSILGFVAAGMGVTLLPRSVVESKTYGPIYGDYISVDKISDKMAIVDTHFIYHRDTFMSKPMKAFLRMVKDFGKTVAN